jgi:hypothetical protein
MAIILFSILFVGTAVANTTFSDKVNNFISTEIEEKHIRNRVGRIVKNNLAEPLIRLKDSS